MKITNKNETSLGKSESPQLKKVDKTPKKKVILSQETSNSSENNDSIEYLDEHFPKGDKRRGEAMVLLAMAIEQGRREERERASKFMKDILKNINKFGDELNNILKN